MAGLVKVPRAYINLVACVPRNTDPATKREVDPPTPVSVQECSPRLHELVQIANPKGIILVGDVAAKNVRKLDIPFMQMVHPAYALRVGRISDYNPSFKFPYQMMREFYADINRVSRKETSQVSCTTLGHPHNH